MICYQLEKAQLCRQTVPEIKFCLTNTKYHIQIQRILLKKKNNNKMR